MPFNQRHILLLEDNLLDDGAGVLTEPPGGQDAPQRAPGQLPGPRPPGAHPVCLPLRPQAAALLSELAALPGVAELGGALSLQRGQLVILALGRGEEAVTPGNKHSTRPTSLRSEWSEDKMKALDWSVTLTRGSDYEQLRWSLGPSEEFSRT